MAGDWIKVRNDLRDDPAVFKIAAAVKLDRFAVIGRLVVFWAWVDAHAVDGRVDAATSTVVDDVVSTPGFADALIAAKWLAVDADGVYIPKHDRHNTESAKERTLKSERQARWRANKAAKETGKPVDGDVDSTPSTREEKRRDSSSLRSEEVGASKSRRTRRVADAITLAAYMEKCKADGAKPVPESHPIRAEAAAAGITPEMLQVAWIVFRRRYLDDEKVKGKRYKDWPAHFANAVRGRWGGLWIIDAGTSQAQWSSNGLQEKAVLDARAKAREVDHEPA